MKYKLTLNKKSSNSGSIHDINAEGFDREIIFQEGCEFAVVLASYYTVSGKGYSTHNEANAIKKSRYLKRKGYSHQIIDREGYFYDKHYDELTKIGGPVASTLNPATGR